MIADNPATRMPIIQRRISKVLRSNPAKQNCGLFSLIRSIHLPTYVSNSSPKDVMQHAHQNRQPVQK
jgi:hypothetical protein